MTTPTTLNMLNPLGFQFQIQQIPNVNFFVVKCNLPGISVGSADVGTPFATLHMAPDKTQYEELSVSFKVDEDMSNWREIFNWLIGLSFPYSSDQRKQYTTQYGNSLQSDGTLSILSSHKNPIIAVKFRDLQPVSLSGIEFDSQASDVDYVTATASFKYTLYELSNEAP